MPSAFSFSRRALLEAAAAFPIAATLLAEPAPRLVYVGSYSSPQGPEGSKGNGQGIYLFEMDPNSGTLHPRETFASDQNPSWLALDPSEKFLFAANETADFAGAKSGSVSSFAVDRATGRLQVVNTVSSQGAGPAHLSVHPSGRYVFVANYAGGTIAVLPVTGNGHLGEARDTKQDQGAPGSLKAASAPPGSFAVSGHERPHAHMIQSDPAGRFILATDLALDRIFVWRFDANTGKLFANDPPWVALPSGDGPRHFVFHPSGKWVYSLQEEGSTVAVFEYDALAGRLQVRQTLSTLPSGFAGTNFTSELVISTDGRLLYAANRLHDSIARFSVGSTGELTYLGETWTRGDYPRSFSIDPSGNFLFTCNQRSDAVATFRVNRQTGDLTFTGQYTPVGTPAIVVFLS